MHHLNPLSQGAIRAIGADGGVEKHAGARNFAQQNLWG